MREKRCDDIGKQNQRQPLKDLPDKVVRRPKEQRDNQRRIQWGPDKRTDTSYHRGGLSHAAQVGANVYYIRYDQKRASTPQYPARISASQNAGESPTGYHSQP